MASLGKKKPCINCFGTGYLDEGPTKEAFPCNSCSWRVGLYPRASWSAARLAAHWKRVAVWEARVKADQKKKGKVQ